jgi:hypothetical protein
MGFWFGLMLFFALLLTIWRHRRTQRIAEDAKKVTFSDEPYMKVIRNNEAQVEIMKHNSSRIEALIMKLNNHEKDAKNTKEENAQD